MGNQPGTGYNNPAGSMQNPAMGGQQQPMAGGGAGSMGAYRGGPAVTMGQQQPSMQQGRY